MAIQFHETRYGKTFFDHQLPALIKALSSIADQLKKDDKEPAQSIKIPVQYDAKILTNLFEGDLCPDEYLASQRSPQYLEHSKEVRRIEETVKTQYGQEAYMLMDRYAEEITKRFSVELSEAFVNGFQTATQLLFAGLSARSNQEV